MTAQVISGTRSNLSKGAQGVALALALAAMPAGARDLTNGPTDSSLAAPALPKGDSAANLLYQQGSLGVADKRPEQQAALTASILKEGSPVAIRVLVLGGLGNYNTVSSEDFATAVQRVIEDSVKLRPSFLGRYLNGDSRWLVTDASYLSRFLREADEINPAATAAGIVKAVSANPDIAEDLGKSVPAGILDWGFYN